MFKKILLLIMVSFPSIVFAENSDLSEFYGNLDNHLQLIMEAQDAGVFDYSPTHIEPEALVCMDETDCTWSGMELVRIGSKCTLRGLETIYVANDAIPKLLKGPLLQHWFRLRMLLFGLGLTAPIVNNIVASMFVYGCVVGSTQAILEIRNEIKQCKAMQEKDRYNQELMDKITRMETFLEGIQKELKKQ